MKGDLCHKDKAYLFHLEKANFFLTLVHLNLTNWLKWDKEIASSELLIYESVIGRVNGVRNLPAMTSLLSRFAYQRQAVFLNLHYAAETWCQSIRMEDCVSPREAKQLEKYERLLNLVSIDTTERLLVTSPRGGMQGMRAKCGKRPHR